MGMGMDLNFFNLHNHTQFSFLDGYGTPEQVSERLKEIGQDGIALTDHGNIYAHAPFSKVFKKTGQHLVYGCEMYLATEDVLEKKRGLNHITLLAKNQEGYKNLLWLVNMSYKQFYYKPRIMLGQLLAHSTGIIVLSGCSLDSILINNKSNDKAKYFDSIVKAFEEIEWYVEIQPFKDEKGKWDFLTTMASRHQIPCVATADCHYPHPKYKNTQDFMLAINTNKPLSDPDRLKMDYPLFIPSAADMYQRCTEDMGMSKADAEDVIEISYAIAYSCNVELPKTGLVDVGHSIEDMRKTCLAGLKHRGKAGEKKYLDRLDYELGLIKEKNYMDYFYIITDMMHWAKANMLCGAGRGSSAGSLVCYLLQITEVDPIKHDLMFERFIDINRSDLPDIDLDFPSGKREEVIQFFRDKYGTANTAQLINFNTYHPKAIIQDAGRILRLPYMEMKDATNQIIERSGGDARADFCLRDSLEQFDKLKALFTNHPKLYDAIDLEGQVRQVGKHAAAVVISKDPLDTIGAVNEKGVFSIDKYCAEAHGLLKVDVLGVNTLDILMDVCAEVGLPFASLYTLPLDDALTYEKVFTPGLLYGIFQFEGLAARQVCREIKPTTFEQLIHITSLSRPGTLNSHTTSEYIHKIKGEKCTDMAFEHSDPALEKYTKDTLGFILFQEQVMKVVKEIGKFSWASTSAIRVAMSKSLGEEQFNKHKADFIKGAAEDDISRERAELIWKQCYTHGSWSFNKSHAVSYSYLSYWCGYMKAHFPAQFYARILRDKTEEDEIKPILKEWGKDIIALDINLSKKYFSASGDVLVGGLVNINGIGEAAADKIEAQQPFESWEDFQSRVPKGIAGKIEAAFLEGIDWANKKTLMDQYAQQLSEIKLTTPLTTCAEMVREKVEHGTVIGRVLAINLRNSNDPDKVAKRGYAKKGYPEYFIIKVRDSDEEVYSFFFPHKLTEIHKQELLSLGGKVCIFKMRIEASGNGISVCEKFRVLEAE
jgi:DNA polymerase III subunit alpha